MVDLQRVIGALLAFTANQYLCEIYASNVTIAVSSRTNCWNQVLPFIKMQKPITNSYLVLSISFSNNNSHLGKQRGNNVVKGHIRSQSCQFTSANNGRLFLILLILPCHESQRLNIVFNLAPANTISNLGK